MLLQGFRLVGESEKKLFVLIVKGFKCFWKTKSTFYLEPFWKIFITKHDLFIFLSWFRQDDFFTEKSNIMDEQLVF